MKQCLMLVQGMWAWGGPEQSQGWSLGNLNAFEPSAFPACNSPTLAISSPATQLLHAMPWDVRLPSEDQCLVGSVSSSHAAPKRCGPLVWILLASNLLLLGLKG